METNSSNIECTSSKNEEFIKEDDMEDMVEVGKCMENEDVEEIREPEIGMEFGNIDEYQAYYFKYGNKKGFPVKVRSTEKDEKGNMRFMILSCSRQGKPKSRSKNALRVRPSCRSGCEAKIRAGICPNGKLKVTRLTLDHNHDLCPGKYRFYRKSQSSLKKKPKLYDKKNITPNKKISSVVVEADGHENMPFLQNDRYNYCDKVRRLILGEGDAMALQNYFQKMQAGNANFFYLMDLDDEGRLRNVFWADARSITAYEEFGDVVTFETTYLTNKYDIPLAPFVGVNHHGQSILFGCGLISSVDIESFTWLFTSWLACMNDHAPTALITDQDKAIKSAIEIIFPNTRHRWCIQHIMKKLSENLSGCNQYDDVKDALQGAVYDSLTCEEFEIRWSSFIEKYTLQENDWLMGLYNERSCWVPVFLNDTFWAGMSSTQRSESMNAFFDGYVNSKTTLKQFVEQYENALRCKVQKEIEEDSNSFNLWIPCISPYPLEKQFQDAYTIPKFREFQEEIKGTICCSICDVKEECGLQVYDVAEDIFLGGHRRVTFRVCFKEEDCDIKCNCQLFEFRGILCRHAFAFLVHKKIYSLPEKYILRRWRKDVKRCHRKVKIIYSDWAMNPENERFDRMCNAFYEVANLAAQNENTTKVVQQWITLLLKELKKNVRTSGTGSSHPTPFEVGSQVFSHDSDPMAKKSNNSGSPLPVRGSN